MRPEIGSFLVKTEDSLKGALKAIDSCALGVCFATDRAGKLAGILTDGDVRRALLAGADLDSPIEKVMRRDFTSLPVSASDEKIQATLSERIRVIPLLDEAGRPVDVASYSSYRKIQVLEPSLSGNELAYVSDCIRTGWISSQGAYVKRFEEALRSYCHGNFALATSNGTVALHLALEALGVGEGDEVIVPDLTFAASANAVIHAGATPIFVDVDARTWTLDVEALKKAITPRTKAVMPVHLYGHACDMDPIMEICRKNGIFVLEDCAEALGTTYKGKPVGSFGDAACFSFFGNKTVTTGEGGMILFRDQAAFERAAVLRDHGMAKDRRYWHEVVGYNYRLTNLQAAVGVAQMERVDGFVSAKRELARSYGRFFSELSGIELPPEASWNVNSYWLYTILVTDQCAVSRDELQAKLLRNGIETRRVFFPMHQMPAFERYVRPGQAFPVSSRVSELGLSLPSSSSLSTVDLEAVQAVISSVLKTRSALHG